MYFAIIAKNLFLERLLRTASIKCWNIGVALFHSLLHGTKGGGVIHWTLAEEFTHRRENRLEVGGKMLNNFLPDFSFTRLSYNVFVLKWYYCDIVKGRVEYV